ncbi:MAG TPA: acyl-CoA dehydrogenase family protein [Methylomirabilota bacterium]|nr:acyl-CoA dehydrogenase family protein [Methylomirabilota bacterium]
MVTSGETIGLVQAAKALRPRILAERDRIEAARRLPDDLVQELTRGGFFRISLPAAYGGLDLPPTGATQVFEELARADASVAWCVWNGNTYWTTVRWPKEVAHRLFADPNTVLGNSTRPSGRAEIVDGGYRVTGRWSLVSGCQFSDWFILLCVVHEAGKRRLGPSGAPELRFVLCPAGDSEIVDTWHVGGLRGTGSHDVVVQDRFVPAAYASSYSDPLVLTDQRYTLPHTARILPGLGAIALGIARTAIDALIELAGGKRQERTSQPLSEDRGAQTRLSQAEALACSARLFLYDTVERIWQDVLAGREATNEARARLRLASWHAVTSACQAVDLVYLSGGATSLYATSPLERAFRDVHAITQHIGVHPRGLETTGRVFFGLEPDIPLSML